MISKTKFKDLIIIKNKPFKDKRGYFKELFRKSEINKKIVSQIKLDISTFTADNIPENLKKLKAIKPGSRNL